MLTMAIKIISEKPITMAELKEDLKNIKERDSELNFRAQKTEEYLNYFVGLDSSQVKELSDKIDQLNVPRFKPEHIAKIIDTLPQNVEEAKVVLGSYPITITNDNLKKIVDAVKPYIEIGNKQIKKQEAEIAKIKKAEEDAAKAAEEQAKAEEENKEEAEKANEEEAGEDSEAESGDADEDKKESAE
ncbi:hypothetical protein GF345_01835 [Candidatus Woesearchaeota archaeon]|nr:hypothetical protein [Candidatus Woesearchaeota archaeon]